MGFPLLCHKLQIIHFFSGAIPESLISQNDQNDLMSNTNIDQCTSALCCELSPAILAGIRKTYSSQSPTHTSEHAGGALNLALNLDYVLTLKKRHRAQY